MLQTDADDHADSLHLNSHNLPFSFTPFSFFHLSEPSSNPHLSLNRVILEHLHVDQHDHLVHTAFSPSQGQLAAAGFFFDNQSLLTSLSPRGGIFSFFQHIFHHYGIDISHATALLLTPDFDTRYGYHQRLRVALPFWEHVIKPPLWVLEGIRSGFPLRWNRPHSELPPINIINHAWKYTVEHLAVGHAMLQQMASYHIITTRPGPGHINLSLFFVNKDITHIDPMKRYRVIINGSPLGMS